MIDRDVLGKALFDLDIWNRYKLEKIPVHHFDHALDDADGVLIGKEDTERKDKKIIVVDINGNIYLGIRYSK